MMPPEVYSALTIADRHLRLARDRRRGFRADARKRRHWAKVQRLVSRAVRILNKRGVSAL